MRKAIRKTVPGRALALQHKAESRSAALRVCHGQSCPMGVGDLLGDAQAQAEVRTVRVGALSTVKTLEDVSLVGIRYAGTVVHDTDLDGKRAAGF